MKSLAHQDGDDDDQQQSPTSREKERVLVYQIVRLVLLPEN